MIFLIHRCRLMMANAHGVATRFNSRTADSNRSSKLDQGARAAGRDRPRIPEPRNAEARGFAVQRLPPRLPPPVSPIRLDPPRERNREITGKPRNQRRCKGKATPIYRHPEERVIR